MNRRCLIFGSTVALIAMPLHAVGQQQSRRIATLATGSPAGTSVIWDTFWQALRALGYADGDIAVESRWASGHPERLPALAAELVQFAPEVIVCSGADATLAAKRVTATIPIVMTSTGDPVGAGLVASLAHPGGNVTGLSSQAYETVAKQLELVKEVIPSVMRVGVLGNPDVPGYVRRSETARLAAHALKMEPVLVEASIPEHIATAFATMASNRIDAAVVLTSPLFGSERSLVVTEAERHRLPTVYDWSVFAEAGGLMSYGTDRRDSYRRAAAYVDKILHGANPANLPIEQPTKFELVINLKTAKAIGLTVPQFLLAQADQVIE